VVTRPESLSLSKAWLLGGGWDDVASPFMRLPVFVVFIGAIPAKQPEIPYTRQYNS